MCLLLWLSLILPGTTSGRGEGPPPFSCPPSLHSAILLQQTTTSQRVVQHTSWGEDQKEDTQIPKGCQYPCSRYTSVRAPQTYSVKCSQGLKKGLGMKKMCVNCLNTKPRPFLLPLSLRVKKVVCNTYDHYDNQKCRNCRGRVDILKGVEYISDCLHFVPSFPTHSYTHSHPSTCPTSPSPTVKHKSYLGGGGGERDLCLITLPLLGQLPQSRAVTTTITPHSSLTSNLLSAHASYFICNFSLEFMPCNFVLLIKIV